MKTLKVPQIDNLESLEFDELKKLMKAKAASAKADVVCWPDEIPYAPDMTFRIARSGEYLLIVYEVKGLDLRAQALEDHGNVWEDSCCEFFVSDPEDGTYYNFELNCIGTLLAAKRKSKEDFTRFTEEQMSNILRYSSLERKQVEINGEEFEWSTALCIPLKYIGVDPENIPESLRANFYKCADLSAHPHFLSWNKVDVPTPNFHLPEFFGTLYF